MEAPYTFVHTIPINPEKFLETQKKNLRLNSKSTNPPRPNHFIGTKTLNQIKNRNLQLNQNLQLSASEMMLHHSSRSNNNMQNSIS